MHILDNYKITDIAVGKIKSEIIANYLKSKDLIPKEFAKRCGIKISDLNKILNYTIPIECILKIERTIGLEKYSLITFPNLSNNGIIYFD